MTALPCATARRRRPQSTAAAGRCAAGQLKRLERDDAVDVEHVRARQPCDAERPATCERANADRTVGHMTRLGGRHDRPPVDSGGTV
eukprot:364607-Chlamydomonas_euryale.AAC.3